MKVLQRICSFGGSWKFFGSQSVQVFHLPYHAPDPYPPLETSSIS